MEESNNKGMKLDPLSNKVRNLKNPIRAIKMIVRERIMPIVDLNIKFVKKGESSIVRIGFNPTGGAWSLVGTDHLKSNNKTTMNFGWLDVGTIIHEFGHMLGLIHEHQNPKGKSIKWDKDKLYAWAGSTQGWSKEMIDKNIIDKYDSDIINGSKYDPDSIMLYFFPAKVTTDKKGTQQNVRLSRYDVIYINKMYPDSELTPEEFYLEAYNEDIDKNKKRDVFSSQKIKEIVKSKIFMYTIISVISLIVLIFIIIMVNKSGLFSKSKSKTYARSSGNRYS